MQDLFKLYAFTLLVQACLLIPYAVRAQHFLQTGQDVLFRILDAVVRAAPPGLPAVILFCGSYSRIRLSKQHVELVFPEKLKLGADTSIVCFDKTGTLTGSTVGVLPLSKCRVSLFWIVIHCTLIPGMQRLFWDLIASAC